MSAYNWKNIKKLGLGIVAFEGTEHLASIISEIKDMVDYVSIGLQRTSYNGAPIDPTDLAEVYRLKDEDGLVDTILEVELDPSLEARKQETDKRNAIIEDAENQGCSHILVIDSDEFYIHDAFLTALKEIDENDYEMTYCQYVNYYKDYQHILKYPFQDGMYVPFVTKIQYRFKFNCIDFRLPSDPTRRYVRPKDPEKYTTTIDDKGKAHKDYIYLVDYHIFPWDTVRMHHLSMLRADIRKKLDMWSAKLLFDDYEDIIDQALERYEHFDENADEQNVTMLLKTPDHQIPVIKLKEQYVRPKCDFHTRLRKCPKTKSILVLNMSSTNSPNGLFGALDDACRRTWAKGCIDGSYPNIDYYTVIDTADEASLINHGTHVITIHKDGSQDNLKQLLDRFMIAYNAISKKKHYDYVIRTNCSTWVNLDVIDRMLSYETDKSKIYTFKLMSAFWSTFNVYMSGAFMIWSDRNMGILTNLWRAMDKNLKNIANDDVIMSALWTSRARGTIKSQNVAKDYVSVEGRYLKKASSSTDFDHIIFDTVAYQIKTFDDERHETRIAEDIKKMEMLNGVWEKTKTDETIDTLARNIVEGVTTNKTIDVLKYVKNEWFGFSEDKRTKLKLGKPMPYNTKTLKLLDELTIKGGYHH